MAAWARDMSKKMESSMSEEDYLPNFSLLEVSVGVPHKTVNGKTCGCALYRKCNIHCNICWRVIRNLPQLRPDRLFEKPAFQPAARQPVEQQNQPGSSMSHMAHHSQPPSKNQDLFFFFCFRMTVTSFWKWNHFHIACTRTDVSVKWR